MRFTRYTPFAVLIGTMLLAPVYASAAASKEMMDLQRDVASAEQAVQDLQKALLDPKTGTITALQTMVQQALDTANKTNSNVNSLNTGMMQTLQNALKGLNDQLGKVNDLSVKVTNMAETDIPNLQSSVQALQVTVNKQGAKLDDILDRVKLLQAPAAAPPPVDSGTGAPGASAVAPQPSAQTLFSNAVTDYNGGRLDMAMSEYSKFLSLYPDDPNAPVAQYQIGIIHYNSSNLEQAVKDFDAVSERYPTDQVAVPNALYMKGMALKQENMQTAAIKTFRDVVKQFPGTDKASQASTQLRSLGVTTTTPKKSAR